VVNDKDLDEIPPLFPKKMLFIIFRPNNPGLNATILAQSKENMA
jgi:hypothetical protein